MRAAQHSRDNGMSAGVEIERREGGGGALSFLVWLISPDGERLLFHEADLYAEALECALEAVPIFGPVLRDDGAETIQ